MGADDLRIPDGERYDIRKLYMHPQYDENTLANDIAIFTVDRPIKFSATVLPICLPSPGKKTLKKASVIGWGNEQFGGESSDILKKVDLIVRKTKECVKSGGSGVRRFIPSVMICAYADYEDSCQVYLYIHFYIVLLYVKCTR